MINDSIFGIFTSSFPIFSPFLTYNRIEKIMSRRPNIFKSLVFYYEKEEHKQKCRRRKRKNCVTNGICFFLVFLKELVFFCKSEMVGGLWGLEKAAKICVYVSTQHFTFIQTRKVVHSCIYFSTQSPQAPLCVIFLYIFRLFLRGFWLVLQKRYAYFGLLVR